MKPAYLKINGPLNAVAQDNSNALHEAGHVGVLRVVPGDDPDQAEGAHQGWYHICDPL